MKICKEKGSKFQRIYCLVAAVAYDMRSNSVKSLLRHSEVEICFAPTVNISTGFCACWWHVRMSATQAAKLWESQAYKVPVHLLPGCHFVLVLHVKPEEGDPSTTFKTPCSTEPQLPSEAPFAITPVPALQNLQHRREKKRRSLI